MPISGQGGAGGGGGGPRGRTGETAALTKLSRSDSVGGLVHPRTSAFEREEDDEARGSSSGPFESARADGRGGRNHKRVARDGGRRGAFVGEHDERLGHSQRRRIRHG